MNLTLEMNHKSLPLNSKTVAAMISLAHRLILARRVRKQAIVLPESSIVSIIGLEEGCLIGNPTMINAVATQLGPGCYLASGSNGDLAFADDVSLYMDACDSLAIPSTTVLLEACATVSLRSGPSDLPMAKAAAGAGSGDTECWTRSAAAASDAYPGYRLMLVWQNDREPASQTNDFCNGDAQDTSYASKIRTLRILYCGNADDKFDRTYYCDAASGIIHGWAVQDWQGSNDAHGSRNSFEYWAVVEDGRLHSCTTARDPVCFGYSVLHQWGELDGVSTLSSRFYGYQSYDVAPEGGFGGGWEIPEDA